MVQHNIESCMLTDRTMSISRITQKYHGSSEVASKDIGDPIDLLAGAESALHRSSWNIGGISHIE